MPTQKQKRKPYPSDLTERQFNLLSPYLAVRPKATGRPKANLKDIVDGVLYVLSTGCRWNDLPHDFLVSDSTCYRYFQYWSKTGKLKRIFEFLKWQANRKNYLHWRNAYLDASDVKSKKGLKNTAAIRENTKLTG